MRFLKCVVLCLISFSSFNALADMELKLENGSSLHIPDMFFNEISILERSRSRTVLSGYRKNSATFMLMAVYPKVPPNFDVLSELSRILGTVQVDYLQIRDENDPSVNFPLYIVRNEGPYEDCLISYKVHYHPNGFAIAYLIGPALEFYEASPVFWSSDAMYTPAPVRKVQREEIELWMVLAALAALGFNMLMVWFGIKQQARLKKAHYSQET